MEVILLEPVNTYKIGDVVKVKAGYARNFLIPKGKAVRATVASREKFEQEKAKYIAKLNDRVEVIKMIYSIINGQKFFLKARASSNMRLFGSINISQIFNLINSYIDSNLKEQGSNIVLSDFINKSLLVGNTTIKALGSHNIDIRFSKDFIATVTFHIENEGVDGGSDESIAQADVAVAQLEGDSSVSEQLPDEETIASTEIDEIVV